MKPFGSDPISYLCEQVLACKGVYSRLAWKNDELCCPLVIKWETVQLKIECSQPMQKLYYLLSWKMFVVWKVLINLLYTMVHTFSVVV